MGRIRRKFDADFKRRIVADIENKVTTLTAAAREHGISPTVIKYWQKQLLEGGIPDSVSSREKAQEKEIKELRAKIGELVMENDILKKMEEWKEQRKKLDTSVVTASNLHQFRRPAK